LRDVSAIGQQLPAQSRSDNIHSNWIGKIFNKEILNFYLRINSIKKQKNDKEQENSFHCSDL